MTFFFFSDEQSSQDRKRRGRPVRSDQARERTPGDDSDEGGRETPILVTVRGRLFITKNKERHILAGKMSFHKIMSAPRY